MSVYRTHNLPSLLSSNRYPGRGIVLGVTPSGEKNVAVYFIMGRSVNSRNRVFEQMGENLVRTKAFDPSLLSDPSLIIYYPVRTLGDRLIVTNGDQTDTVMNGMNEGKSFFEALETREFEPDGPNFTPRISGLLSQDGSHLMSILKSADEEGTACTREGFSFPAIKGVGHFLHTYLEDGDPLPTFCGEPERVDIEEDMDSFAEKIWNSLDSENKISLYVRYQDVKTGEYSTKIFNKHLED